MFCVEHIGDDFFNSQTAFFYINFTLSIVRCSNKSIAINCVYLNPHIFIVTFLLVGQGGIRKLENFFHVT